MADPAFWEDGGDTELQRERTGLEQRLAEGARLVATFDDTDAMLELAEEGEHEAITLLQKTIADLSSDLDSQETQHLLRVTHRGPQRRNHAIQPTLCTSEEESRPNLAIQYHQPRNAPLAEPDASRL